MPGTTPSVPDVIECQVLSAFQNQIGLNVLHYWVSSTSGTGVTLQFMATQMDALLQANYKNILCNQATYRGVGMTNLASPRSVQAVSAANAGPGTGGANMAPTQVRGLISWYSNLAGRAYRGRTYTPFVPANGVQTDGSPLPAYVTILDAVRVILAGPIVFTSGANTSTISLAIYHRRPLPATFSAVTLSITRNKFATQRRSGQYGRANTIPF